MQIKELTNVINAMCDALKETGESGLLEKLNEGERIRRYFDEEEERWINDVMPPIEKIEAVTDGCVITDEPVSYTHLDVYKRQPASSAYCLFMPPMRRAEPAATMTAVTFLFLYIAIITLKYCPAGSQPDLVY